MERIVVNYAGMSIELNEPEKSASGISRIMAETEGAIDFRTADGIVSFVCGPGIPICVEQFKSSADVF